MNLNKLAQKKYYYLRRLKSKIINKIKSKSAGMTTLEEQKYYKSCSESLLEQKGAIVDLGCWLGSTSIGLAKGLISNKNGINQNKVYAFDIFIWEKWMNPYNHLLSKKMHPGECFLEETKKIISPFSKFIELRKEDLTSFCWTEGNIKILLVDAMKNKKLTQSIAKSFYPSLSKGSLLLHQDFKHYWTPWIHILQYRLRSNFQLLQNVEKGSTVAFKTIKKLNIEQIEIASNFTNVSEEEIKKVFEYSFNLVEDTGKQAIAAAHVMFYVHSKNQEQAIRTINKYIEKGMILKDELLLAKKAITSLN